MTGDLNKDGDDNGDATAAAAAADADADARGSAAGDDVCPDSHELVTVRVNMFVSGSMVGGCGLAPPSPAPPPPRGAEPVNSPAAAPCCAIDAEFKCSDINVPPAKTGGAKYPTLPPTATATALEADLSCRQPIRTVW